jgi:hypothetical protein
VVSRGLVTEFLAMDNNGDDNRRDNNDGMTLDHALALALALTATAPVPEQVPTLALALALAAAAAPPPLPPPAPPAVLEALADAAAAAETAAEGLHDVVALSATCPVCGAPPARKRAKTGRPSAAERDMLGWEDLTPEFLEAHLPRMDYRLIATYHGHHASNISRYVKKNDLQHLAKEAEQSRQAAKRVAKRAARQEATQATQALRAKRATRA